MGRQIARKGNGKDYTFKQFRGGKILTEEPVGLTKLESFLGALPNMSEGLGRSYCSAWHKGIVGLRVRTDDHAPDTALIAQVTEMVGEPKLQIKLDIRPEGNVYQISRDAVPLGDMEAAKKAVKIAGKVFVEAKEIAQGLAQEDTRQLMGQLSKA